jgi:hypothetical protein
VHGNLSCAYTHTLSWRSKTQPLPMEWNRARCSSGSLATAGDRPRAREERLQQHKSILDSVTDKLASLRRSWDRETRSRSTNTPMRFATWNVGFSERGSAASSCRARVAPGAPPVFEDHLALMLDSAAAGISVGPDARHLIHDLQGAERAAVSPDWRAGGASPLSHHNNVPELVAKLSKINRYHAQLFAQYLGKLRATPTATARCWTT